ncbi:MAG: hypothetical protein IKN53_04045, partial [Oscillibacter sp.]|nr:hypothetical protein [Oscillibacter sp.]
IVADDSSQYGFRIDCPLPRAAKAGEWTYDVEIKDANDNVICEDYGLDINAARPTSTNSYTVRLYGGLKDDAYRVAGTCSLKITFHFMDEDVIYFDMEVAAQLA